MYDLQQWMGAPSIYVYDCSSAGLILESFNKFAIQHEREFEISLGSVKGQAPPCYRSCIQLAACRQHQVYCFLPPLWKDSLDCAAHISANSVRNYSFLITEVSIKFYIWACFTILFNILSSFMKTEFCSWNSQTYKSLNLPLGVFWWWKDERGVLSSSKFFQTGSWSRRYQQLQCVWKSCSLLLVNLCCSKFAAASMLHVMVNHC